MMKKFIENVANITATMCVCVPRYLFGHKSLLPCRVMFKQHADVAAAAACYCGKNFCDCKCRNSCSSY